MKGVAYTGNNMLLSQKNIENYKKLKDKETLEDQDGEVLDLSGVYMTYSEAGLEQEYKDVVRVKSGQRRWAHARLRSWSDGPTWNSILKFIILQQLFFQITKIIFVVPFCIYFFTQKQIKVVPFL